jgi:antitoxin component YwqK of YwqJK toxin-antitoxin module
MKINGLSEPYYPNGKKKRVGHWKNGQEDGVIQNYDNNGKLINQETWELGHLLKR